MFPKKIRILSTAFPPDLDGIGDHTWWLAKALSGYCQVEVITSSGTARDKIAGVPVLQRFDLKRGHSIVDIERLMEPREAGTDEWLLVQYNPFAFGRRGFCPWLPIAVSRGKKRGVRVAVMFHETMAPKHGFRYRVMRLWQKPILRHMLRLADVKFISTGRWALDLRPIDPRPQYVHLPVGSNVERSPLSKMEARKRNALSEKTFVVGLYGSNHPSRLFEWCGEAARALDRVMSDVLYLYVGPHGRAIAKYFDGVQFRDQGPVPGNAVGSFFRCMDLFLVPFTDGLTTRRGSFMTGLQHGVPLVTNCTRYTEKTLLGLSLPGLACLPVMTSSDYAQGVVTHAVVVRRMRPESSVAMSDYYDSHFSWPVIADQLTRALGVAGLELDGRP